MPQSVASIIDQALAMGIAPSISFSQGAHNYYGGYTDQKFLVPTDNHTLYDLASLTKILGTTLAVARALIDNHMSLNEEPFPSWPGVSIRDLLAHTSGLVAHIKFYECAQISSNFSSNAQIIYKNLFEQRPAYESKKLRLYSDLNFLALGLLLEQRLRKPLIEIFKNTWDKLKIPNNLRFFSSAKTPNKINNVAPTGFCPKRGMHIRAQVHDLNCYYLGGLAGHAGLFGDLNSLNHFGHFFLRCVKKPKNAYEYLIADFARLGLGFDKPLHSGSVRALSPRSFGHFGFSGTSLWVDPCAKDNTGEFYVLLSNRVAASLRPEGIFWLRRRLHQIRST